MIKKASRNEKFSQNEKIKVNPKIIRWLLKKYSKKYLATYVKSIKVCLTNPIIKNDQPINIFDILNIWFIKSQTNSTDKFSLNKTK